MSAYGEWISVGLGVYLLGGYLGPLAWTALDRVRTKNGMKLRTGASTGASRNASVGVTKVPCFAMQRVRQNENGQAEILRGKEIKGDQFLFVSVIVPAKNEEAVIERVIESLAKCEYPAELFEVIVVDDHSQDRTSEIVKEKKKTFPWLKLLSRVECGGGKAGAMNSGYSVLDHRSQIVGYLDADTTITRELISDMCSLFLNNHVYAVQVARMVRPNQCFGLLEKLQYFEVWMDLCYQKTRDVCGGGVEFRGNGEFLRVSLLDAMGGMKAWNEDSLTDDLDMSLRIHMLGFNILLYDSELILDDPVHTWDQLWSQRQRWMRGGFQRFVDYCYYLIFHPYSWRKKLDFLHTFGCMNISFLLELSSAIFPACCLCCRFGNFSLLGPIHDSSTHVQLHIGGFIRNYVSCLDASACRCFLEWTGFQKLLIYAFDFTYQSTVPFEFICCCYRVLLFNSI